MTGNVFKRTLTFIDILGDPISLILNKHNTSKTVLGGIMTMLMCTCLFVGFCILISDIFYKKNPSIIFETAVLNYYPAINISSKNLPIAVGIEDYYGNKFEDKSFLDIVATFNYYDFANQNFTITRLNLNTCTAEDVPMLTEQEFENLKMGDHLCLKNYSGILKGYWSEDITYYLSFSLVKCNNSTGVKCKSEEEIDKKINGSPLYYNLYMINTNLDPQDYLNPFTSATFYQNKVIQSNIYKEFDFFLGENVLKTDTGFLLENIHQESGILFDTFFFDQGPEGLYGSLLNYCFYSSNKKQNYSRTYTKIQTVLATIGGLANAFLFILRYSCYTFSVTKKYENILDNVFNFDFQDSEYKNCNQISKSTIKRLSDPYQNTQFVRNISNKNDRNQNFNLNNLKIASHVTSNINTNKISFHSIPLSKLKSKVNQAKTKSLLNFTYFDIMKMYLCERCSRKASRVKIEIFKKSKEVLDEYLEISNFTKKQGEFEKLKQILLDKQQYYLFNMLTKELYIKESIQGFVDVNTKKRLNHKS